MARPKRKYRPPKAPGTKGAVYAEVMGLPPRSLPPLRKVREVAYWMARGFSKRAACGKVGMLEHALVKWEDRYQEVRDTIALAHQQRLFSLEGKLLEDGAPMPQVVSRIFALKNADPETWSDKPQAAVPGLTQNLTIITGVPATHALSALEKGQVRSATGELSHQDATDAIDVTPQVGAEAPKAQTA